MSNTLFDPSIYGIAEGETLLSKLSGLAGGSLQTAVGFALGFAASNALGPLATELEQVAWAALQVRALDPGTAATIVAEDVRQKDWGASEAAQHGVNGERFDALVGEILNAPGVPELFEAWRRDLIDEAAFEHGLRKAKLETRWDAPLKALKDRLLSVELLAAARQQGFVTPERQHSESALQGVDAERAEIMFEVVGLPPGHAEAQQAANRGLASRELFDQIVREGHTKTKYSDLLFAMRRHLLTPTQYVEGHLRGWITEPEMTGGAALSGMEPGDVDILFKLSGRPIPEHQVTTGEARGGVYNGPTSQIPEAFLRALEQGSLRPEWYDLAYHNRYTYPSAFVLRSLAQTGELSPADVEKTLLEIGWRPDFAAKVTAAWTGGAKGKADAHVAKAETQLWSALHKSYVAQESDAAAVTPGLHAAGVADPAAVLALWDAERALIHAQLTPAQIKKAAKNLSAEWPRARALAALEARGFSADEAATLLDE